MTWIVGDETGTNTYHFDEMHVNGSSNLAFRAMGNDEAEVTVTVGYLYGDKSGKHIFNVNLRNFRQVI